MRPYYITLFCLLTTVLYLFSPTISKSSSSSSSSSLVPTRKLMSRSMADDKKHKYYTTQVAEEMNGSNVEDGPMAVKGRRREENLDELVYHIDYHGVTTHPTPTPRHPKP